MSVQAQVTLRTRKLGVLIRDARLSKRKTIPECAQAIGVTPGLFKTYEEGRRAPSLPEMEILTYFLELPIRHFWSQEAVSDDKSPINTLNLSNLITLRQRMIGALLRQEREKAGLSVKTFSEQCEISLNKLRAFELGEKPIPLPELEGLLSVLGGQIETFFDQTGPVGQWMNQQKSMNEFLKLPVELQEFVCKPVNHPYLELALKLSSLSTEKLRSVAEGLLDITF